MSEQNMSERMESLVYEALLDAEVCGWERGNAGREDALDKSKTRLIAAIAALEAELAAAKEDTVRLDWLEANSRVYGCSIEVDAWLDINASLREAIDVARREQAEDKQP